MLGIPQEVTRHTLNIKSASKLIKSVLRWFNQEKC
jgi:hypothetical protein